MLFMLKQVSLSKISSILQKMKIDTKSDICPFCMKAFRKKNEKIHLYSTIDQKHSFKDVHAYCYCTRKFTCHVMHQAHTLCTKMNSDRADSHFSWLVLLGFICPGCLVIPTFFFFRKRFYLQLSPHCPEIIINKNSMWEFKKISRVMSMGHWILPSCGSKVHETMVTKCELVL